MRSIPNLYFAIFASMLLATTIGCDRSHKSIVSQAPKDDMLDVTLVYETSSSSSINIGNLKLKGERQRTDREDGLFSIISDPEVGTILLDHTQKNFRVMHSDYPDIGTLGPEIPARLASAYEMKLTGKTQKIGRFECEELLVFDSINKGFPDELQFRYTQWITKDLKNGAAIQARLDNLAQTGFLYWVKTSISKKVAIPGFAVRTEITNGRHSHDTLTCLEVVYGTLNSEDFLIPPDYTDRALK